MVNGRFYFVQTENNNLIGEYSNQFSTSNVTECANVITSNGDYIGRFQTTWFEENESRSISMILDISFKPESFNRIYSLRWQEGDNISFHGEGFIVNNILIGNYWDNELNKLN